MSARQRYSKSIPTLLLLLAGCASAISSTNEPRGSWPDASAPAKTISGQVDAGFQSEVMWDRPDAGCGSEAFALGDKCTVCDPANPKDCYERCLAGNGDACAVDGLERRSLRQGTDLLERGCNLGSGTACVNFAQALMRGEGRPKDEPEGMRILEKMCEFGRGFACSSFAIGLLKGEGRVRDVDAAERNLSRACNLKDELGCRLLRDDRRFTDLPKALQEARTRVANCKFARKVDDCVGGNDGGFETRP